MASLRGWPLVIVVGLRLLFAGFVIHKLCDTVVRVLELEHKPPWLQLIIFLVSPGIALIGGAVSARWKENKVTEKLDVGIMGMIGEIAKRLSEMHK
jgi:hypothetical protein